MEGIKGREKPVLTFATANTKIFLRQTVGSYSANLNPTSGSFKNAMPVK
jgi:hypothetical protein